MSSKFKYTGGRNENQLKDGSGTFEANDLIYKGRFCNGLSHGLGVLHSAEKFRYKGNFEKGRFHGLGVLNLGDVLFEGQFIEGKIHGKGRVTFADRTSGMPPYQGLFEKGIFKHSETCDKVIQDAQKEAVLAEAGCNNFNHEQF